MNKTLVNTAKSFGMVIRKPFPYYNREPVWNPPVLRVNNNRDLSHELAHFVVASNSRKYTTNYGLGNDAYAGKAMCNLSYKFIIQEETMASFLGVLILRYLKLTKLYCSVWKDENWHVNAAQNVKEARMAKNKLFKIGAIKWGTIKNKRCLIPTFLVS